MKTYKHPFIDDHTKRIVWNILESGELSMFRGTPEGNRGGQYVQALEDAFCQYFGVKHAISMNSATACLHSALIACDIKWGDEVIVSPYTFSSSASCVLMAGAVPVFADIEPDTFCLSPQSISRAITPRTKAIIPVHLCGHPANMDAIMGIAREHNLKVIEDAAQSIGAMYHGEYAGTIGDCGIFSFNQSKQISTGEGGMLITNDDRIADLARQVRNHGEVAADGILGWNYRLCEVEAAMALGQFNRLETNIAWRISLASYMTEKLSQINGLIPPVTQSGCKHSFYTYAVKYNKNVIGMHRDEFQDKMLARGIYFGKGYVKPIYLQSIYQNRNHEVYRYFGKGVDYNEGLCPVTERMWKEELLVFDWMRHPATKTDIDDAIKIVKEVIQDANR